MMTDKEALTAALEIIQDPDRWCQQHWAVDEWGGEIPPGWHTAAKWCASGALCKVVGSIKAFRLTRKLDAVAGVDTGAEVIAVHVNDHMGHGDVVAMYKRAIAAEGGE